MQEVTRVISSMKKLYLVKEEHPEEKKKKKAINWLVAQQVEPQPMVPLVSKVIALGVGRQDIRKKIAQKRLKKRKRAMKTKPMWLRRSGHQWPLNLLLTLRKFSVSRIQFKTVL